MQYIIVWSSVVWYKLKSCWDRYNPFDIPALIARLDNSLTGVTEGLQSIEDKLDNEIDTIEGELRFHKALLYAIGETVPDMIWLKGLDGKYIYANNAIRRNLLFCNPIGKDDVECAIRAKSIFGEDNHTFGEVCGSSDVIIMDTLKPQRFLESGKIKGKMVYLEVFKAPFYVDGILAGICGTGRDMTEYVETYRANGCGDCPSTRDIFAKYEFRTEG